MSFHISQGKYLRLRAVIVVGVMVALFAIAVLGLALGWNPRALWLGILIVLAVPTFLALTLVFAILCARFETTTGMEAMLVFPTGYVYWRPCSGYVDPGKHGEVAKSEGEEAEKERREPAQENTR